MEETNQFENEELNTEDQVEENTYYLDALIELLIEKSIITREELDKKLEQLEEE